MKKYATINTFILGIALLAIFSTVLSGRLYGQDRRAPNVVIIFTDDQGYSDVGVFGAEGFKTPAIDSLAKDGCRFTSFDVPESSCSPSRAALLTGCYPYRINLPDVLFPTCSPKPENRGYGKTGLNPKEITLAEILKQQGYATACIGKWHLGDAPKFLPTQQGFDLFFGLPYSHDMHNYGKRTTFPPLPLYDAAAQSPDGVDNSARVTETNPDLRFLTQRYTKKAVKFIQLNKDKPFFLYLAHSMPHIPLAVSPEFEGSSEHGLYGDVIQEIDASVEKVLDAIHQNGLDGNTIIIYASDNGPWQSCGEDGGHCAPLRQAKGTRYEGGHRTPCLMRWTGKIPAGQTRTELIGSIDIFPTIAAWTGAAVPSDRIIDGVNQADYITGAAEHSARTLFFYQKQAVREGNWKLYPPGTYREVGPNMKRHYIQKTYNEIRLYNLESDISETTNIAKEHPEIVQRLQKRLEEFRLDIQKNSRPCGRNEK